jgi:hypothetical protein
VAKPAAPAEGDATCAGPAAPGLPAAEPDGEPTLPDLAAAGLGGEPAPQDLIAPHPDGEPALRDLPAAGPDGEPASRESGPLPASYLALSSAFGLPLPVPDGHGCPRVRS